MAVIASTLRDCCNLLGVSPKASLHEVKAAYRSLARRYHPDLNPNDRASEENFKAINAAYEMLCQGLGEVQAKPSSPPHRTVVPNATYNAFIDGLMGFTYQR
jgi:preprotein translocase subunit Sec63